MVWGIILGGALGYGTKKYIIDPVKKAEKAAKEGERRMRELEEEQRNRELQRRREMATENKTKVDTAVQQRTSQVNRALRTSMLGRRGFLIPTIGTGGSTGIIGGI